MTKAEELRLRPERLKQVRDMAGYTQQGMANALSAELGKTMSLKVYRAREDGTYEFSATELDIFLELTNSTKEFLRGHTDSIRVKGLFRDLMADSYNQLTIPQLVA